MSSWLVTRQEEHPLIVDGVGSHPAQLVNHGQNSSSWRPLEKGYRTEPQVDPNDAEATQIVLLDHPALGAQSSRRCRVDVQQGHGISAPPGLATPSVESAQLPLPINAGPLLTKTVRGGGPAWSCGVSSSNGPICPEPTELAYA